MFQQNYFFSLLFSSRSLVSHLYLSEVQELQVLFEGVQRDTVSAKDSLWSDLVRSETASIWHGVLLPACENVTNAELFDGKRALVGSCKQNIGHVRIFVSSSSCVKSTSGANLATRVSIPLFPVLMETLGL